MSLSSAEETPAYRPNLAGADYLTVLKRLHSMLKPKSYLEVGVHTGSSLALSECKSIGVDPRFMIESPAIMAKITGKPFVMLFGMGSDDFFQNYDPSRLLGQPVEMAFLDGMHHCEFLLRDFTNTEAHCKSNSIVVLHDCLPVDSGIAARVRGSVRSPAPHRFGWWAGDVWRTSLLLKRRRPDLKMTVLDASPTGLVLITNLDPTNTKLREGYAGYVDEMLSWNLDEIGVEALFAEMEVESTSAIETSEQLGARFSL
jgi:hypothetical protein